MIELTKLLRQIADPTPGSVASRTEPPVYVADDDGSLLAALGHDSGWLVGFRLAWETDGTLAVAEMAVRPASAQRIAESFRRLPFGALLAEARGDISSLLEAGIEFSPGRVLASAPRVADSPSGIAEYLLAFAESIPRGARRPDSDYAGLSHAYDMLVARGVRSPVKEIVDIATKSNGDTTTAQVWANRLSEARSRGMLTTGGGKASGRLTDKARRLLGLEGSSDAS